MNVHLENLHPKLSLHLAHYDKTNITPYLPDLNKISIRLPHMKIFRSHICMELPYAAAEDDCQAKNSPAHVEEIHEGKRNSR